MERISRHLNKQFTYTDKCYTQSNEEVYRDTDADYLNNQIDYVDIYRTKQSDCESRHVDKTSRVQNTLYRQLKW